MKHLAIACMCITFATLSIGAVKAAFDISATINKRAVQVQCATDTECLALCPPSDAACDGGPQS